MDDATKSNVGMRITSDPDVTKIASALDERARRAVDLPLRVLFVSDLTPQETPPDWSGPSRLMRVDRNTFTPLFEQLSPRLSLEVPNRISDGPKTLDVDLSFSSIRSFHPEHVARQVPALAQLLDLRTLVDHVSRGDLEMHSFRSQMIEAGVDPDWADQLYETLAAAETHTSSGAGPAAADPPRSASGPQPAATGPSRAAPHDAPPEQDAVDRLLNMVDLGGNDPVPDSPGGDQRPPKSSFMGALVDAVAGASESKPRVERTVAGQLIHDLDRLISDQLNAVMGHRAFRRLEGSWRGLKLIVDRSNFQKNIQLDVLATGRDQLSDALYHQVLLPEHSSDHDRPPLSVAVLDFTFDNGQADVALLQDIAETGASLQVPIITSADPSFFGVAEPEGLDRLPSLRQHLEGPRYIAWNRLREEDDAKHLALVVPPVLLRARYGDGHPAEAFEFSETGQLWGGGALAVTVLITTSFGRTGWPTRLYGNGENRIENLPLWASARGHIPLAVLLPEHKQAELADAGFVVLACRPDRDWAYIAHAPTVRYTGAYEKAEMTDEMRSHFTLPSQLFVSRAAQFLLSYQTEVSPGTPVEQVQSDLEARLRAFLGETGRQPSVHAVEVSLVPELQSPEHDVLAIRLRPPATILDESVSLVMQMQVPR